MEYSQSISYTPSGSFHEIKKNLVIVTNTDNDSEFSRPFIAKLCTNDMLSWIENKCESDILDKITFFTYVEPLISENDETKTCNHEQQGHLIENSRKAKREQNDEDCSPSKIKKKLDLFTCPICLREYDEVVFKFLIIFKFL